MAKTPKPVRQQTPQQQVTHTKQINKAMLQQTGKQGQKPRQPDGKYA